MRAMSGNYEIYGVRHRRHREPRAASHRHPLDHRVDGLTRPMHPPFVVFSLPRSRSAWLAWWLSRVAVAAACTTTTTPAVL